MRLIDAEPIERNLLKEADKSLAKNPYEKARICAFRKAFEMVVDAPTISSPQQRPNDPLTLDELRKMDGEPVWIEYIPSPGEETAGFWALVSADKEDDEIFLLNSLGGSSSYEEAWADIRAIYRHKPEEGRR